MRSFILTKNRLLFHMHWRWNQELNKKQNKADASSRILWNGMELNVSCLLDQSSIIQNCGVFPRGISKTRPVSSIQRDREVDRGQWSGRWSEIVLWHLGALLRVNRNRHDANNNKPMRKEPVVSGSLRVSLWMISSELV